MLDTFQVCSPFLPFKTACSHKIELINISISVHKKQQPHMVLWDMEFI